MKKEIFIRMKKGNFLTSQSMNRFLKVTRKFCSFFSKKIGCFRINRNKKTKARSKLLRKEKKQKEKSFWKEKEETIAKVYFPNKYFVKILLRKKLLK